MPVQQTKFMLDLRDATGYGNYLNRQTNAYKVFDGINGLLAPLFV